VLHPASVDNSKALNSGRAERGYVEGKGILDASIAAATTDALNARS
jgi:hypothetical protein